MTIKSHGGGVFVIDEDELQKLQALCADTAADFRDRAAIRRSNSIMADFYNERADYFARIAKELGGP